MLCLERGIEIKAVPVMAEDRFANDADRLFTQFISNSGKPFGPLENARLFKRLIDMGWQQQDVAKKTGFSGGRISQLLELLTLPIVLQKFITEGKASASMVLNGGEGEGGGSSKAPKGHSLKAFMKSIVEKAYAEERIDDTEAMVTMTLTEADWAELMEKIDY